MFLREITYFFGTKLLVPRNDNREVKFDTQNRYLLIFWERSRTYGLFAIDHPLMLICFSSLEWLIISFQILAKKVKVL